MLRAWKDMLDHHSGWCSILRLLLFRCLGTTPISGQNALGAKRPFSELWQHSGVFSEQLSKFRKRFSECKIPLSEWRLMTCEKRKPEFSEPLPERFLKLVGTHVKDLHLPLHSRSVFQKIGVVPTRQSFPLQDLDIPEERGQAAPNSPFGYKMENKLAMLNVIFPTLSCGLQLCSHLHPDAEARNANHTVQTALVHKFIHNLFLPTKFCWSYPFPAYWGCFQRVFQSESSEHHPWMRNHRGN